MFIKITTVLSILTISCGQSSELQQTSKQAISTQSFVRQDVPLSYKYSAIHTYTTKKPEQIQETGQYHSGINYQGIQYAPLSHAKPKGQVQKLYTKVTEPFSQYTVNNEYTSETTIKKDHLEPKPVVKNLAVQLPFHFPYIPGHNIEVLQSINRSPGHNAVYRSYPEDITTKDENTKINYERAFTLYKKPENQLQISSENSNGLDKTRIVVPEQNHKQYSNIYKIGHIPSRDKLTNENRYVEHLQFPKMHKFILNVGRAYNIARHNFKAPVKNEVYSKTPTHTQAIIRKDSSLLEAPSNKITYLFPLSQNKKSFSTHLSP
ncbi:uncharacterized protein LOC116413586 [Galleria mellonella]|uniref:Uncharacterized protein LOC116413586 n=1 Tax=Galleria mellonella TaxID=7137 RepID=A0A6J3CEC0_GALME|nr:uncharacterized protein LOC116413586 [Galleria mellonella]